MPALTRIFHKVFGANGATANFGQFASAVTGTPVATRNIASIMANAAWEGEGWKDAVAPLKPAPALEEMNSLFFVHSYQTAYLFQSGIPEWDASTTYYANSVVRVGPYWYTSLTDGNVGNIPPAGATDANWQWVNAPSTPPGVMADFGGITAPLGWLLQDGAAYSRANYPALFAALSVVKACNTTSGSPIVTGIDTTAGFGVGQYVEGAGIPAGSRILSVNSGTQITLDNNASASAAISLRMSPWGLGDGSTTFNVPDSRRKVTYGAGSGVTAGLSGGAESVTLTAAQSGLPAHTHIGVSAYTQVAQQSPDGSGFPLPVTAGGVTGGAVPAAEAHSNMPPYLVCTKIIKY